MATPTVSSIANCDISAASPALSVRITCDNANYVIEWATFIPTGGGGMLGAQFDSPIPCGVGTHTISLPLTQRMINALGSSFSSGTSNTVQWNFGIYDSTTEQQIGVTDAVTNTVRVTSAAAPTITKVTLSEYNSTVAAVTNGAGFIKNKSDLYVSITANGNCGANLTIYEVVLGTQSLRLPFAAFEFGTITVSANTVNVTVEDSRGYSTTKSVPITIVNYTNPRIISASAERKYLTPNAATYSVVGKIDPVVLGGVKRNSVQSLQLRYWSSGVGWLSTTITPTENANGSFTSEGSRGFIASKLYKLQFVVTDAFSETASSAEITLPITLPELYCGDQKVGIRTYTPQTELDVNGVITQNEYPIMGYIGSLSVMPTPNLDLNDVRTDGVYKLFPAAHAIANEANRHYPFDSVAGILEVFSAPLGENILQRFTPWNCSCVCYRISYNSGSTWSSWVYTKTESIPR